MAFKFLLNSLKESNSIVQSLIYSNYCFNRARSPHITVEQWKLVYGDQTEDFEALFQKEKEVTHAE